MPPTMSKTREIRKINMIKTLRITSIIAAILAVGFFTFPAAFGSRNDKGIKQFLSLPSVVEEFRKARGDKHGGDKDQISPLLKEAKAFGNYLNPPKSAKKTKTVRKPPPRGTVLPPPPEPPRTTAKFKLIATSCYASRPELSLALIDEVGKGRHWVRESSVVGHLTIEQIKDGLIVVKGAKRTYEIPAQARPQLRSLLADSAPVSMGPSSQIRSKPGPALGSSKVGSAAATDAGVTSSDETQQMSFEGQAALAEKIFAEIAAMSLERRTEPNKTGLGHGTKVNTEVMEKVLSNFRTMRISGKEAKKLGNLGQKLKDAPKDVEQDPNRPKSHKIEKSTEKSWTKRKSKTSSRPKRQTTPRGRPQKRRK